MRRNSRFKPRDEPTHRINKQIRVPEVRLVGDNLPKDGVMHTREALQIAEEAGLELVEISPTAKPPVCKVIDFSKFRYEQKKRQKEMKAKVQKVVVKEIRFGPNTDDHDFNFKTKHAVEFLKEGAKIKAYVHFVGRSIVFKDRGRDILDRFREAVKDYGKVDQEPKLEGKRMIMFFSPSKTTKK